jgi:hypothetical protein
MEDVDRVAQIQALVQSMSFDQVRQEMAHHACYITDLCYLAEPGDPRIPFSKERVAEIYESECRAMLLLAIEQDLK